MLASSCPSPLRSPRLGATLVVIYQLQDDRIHIKQPAGLRHQHPARPSRASLEQLSARQEAPVASRSPPRMRHQALGRCIIR